MYSVTMICMSCGGEFQRQVDTIEEVETALDDPVDICPRCAHAATLATEEEAREELGL